MRKQNSRTGEKKVSRIITAEVDEQWFQILSQITRHQDGFIWIGVTNATANPDSV
jgi:hypothetical protein